MCYCFTFIYHFQLNLIDGINNDVIISTVIDGGHLFLQQPLHPSYPSLNVLQNCMNQSYSSFESPSLPNFNANTVCVGLIDGHWYRLQIIEHMPVDSMCLAKYLDYGGYCHIQTTELRQIRTDFMSVPFQAIECYLSDIKPKGKYHNTEHSLPIYWLHIQSDNLRVSILIENSDGQWSEEAFRTIVELTQFRALQAQVAGYTENGIPEILLYSFLGPNVSIKASYICIHHTQIHPLNDNRDINDVFVFVSFFSLTAYCIYQSRVSS